MSTYFTSYLWIVPPFACRETVSPIGPSGTKAISQLPIAHPISTPSTPSPEMGLTVAPESKLGDLLREFQ